MEQDLFIATHGCLGLLLRMHQSIKSGDIVVHDILRCIVSWQVADKFSVCLDKQTNGHTRVSLLNSRQVTLKFFEALDECLLLLFPVSLLVGMMPGSKLFSERVSVLKVGRYENVDADHKSMCMILLQLFLA